MAQTEGVDTSQERYWGVDELPLTDRLPAWCEIIAKTHLAFAINPSDESPGPFSAHVREHRMGELGLFDTDVQPHSGLRTRRQVSANTRDVIGLHVIRSGKQAVEIGGERVVLGPGDAMIWDGAATGRYEIIEPLRKTTLIVPRSAAAAILPSYRNDFVRTLHRDRPPTRALIQVLATLSDQLPAMGQSARQAAAALVLQLMKSLDLPADLSEPGTSPWSRGELRERALQYIDDHLGDPLLRPATIAAAHAVSLRTLYSAIDGLGVTPAAYIRTRRLAQGYEDLMLGTDPVGEIAHRWGFSGHAQFSRAFQQQYGISPSRLRKERRTA